MPFFEQLLLATEAQKMNFLSAPIIADVLEGHFTQQTYLCFLNQAYHHVRHTTPLLMAAGGRLQPHQEWVRKTMSHYIVEEIGHEQWILDDIEALGYERARFADGEPPVTSEVMVAYLYDYVQRKNPMGIFGMVLVLEGTSSSLAPTVGSLVQAKLALPDTAMTYLTTHGELDQEHMTFFEATMNKITDPADQAAIIHVANMTYQLYGDVYRAIPALALAASGDDSVRAAA
jgi:pyrroloquinoline quinone (PQQ) biosynthesis protein C